MAVQNGRVTPAITLLEKKGIAHRVITYDHDPGAESYGAEAADALGVEPTHVFKSLLVALVGEPKGSSHGVGVVPVAYRLDLKAMASATGAKKAAMADKADAERLTGYVLGGISPLGQKKRLPTVIDTSAEALDLVYVSGGRRGLEIELSPTDLVELLGASFAAIGA